MKHWMVLQKRETLNAEKYYASARESGTGWISVGDKRKTPLEEDDKGVIVVAGGNGPRAIYAAFVVTGEARRCMDPEAQFLENPTEDTEKWRVPIRYTDIPDPPAETSLKMYPRAKIREMSPEEYKEAVKSLA